MSDELTPGHRFADEDPGEGANRSELSVALRELAQDHETPLVVTGAEIRRRAVRRRRRRKASLAAVGTAGAGALAALLLALVLTDGEDARSVPPAASYGVKTPPTNAQPSPVVVAATVDLDRRTLIAGGRTVPISAGTGDAPTPTGLMTITAKYPATMVPGAVAGWHEYEVKAAWVMRLRGPDDRTNYLLALGWDEKAPGTYDATGGAIGLRTVDAMWLYKTLKPGAVVEVVGSATSRPTPAPEPSASGPRTPPTARETATSDPSSLATSDPSDAARAEDLADAARAKELADEARAKESATTADGTDTRP
ncbi:L,D-transpeptidase [Streptomyces ortus]|uniref:L,D-transpeptidase family protein n=1 Tax=Streptomyces ortus TaxID=2867268 RepID=A0ABT3V6L5_9ACTN|nr:L,D-transpeptidase [Streptomyces ortus]MCX4235625.1 L,D-transpeptidase family protein [Streptomyces ortus]